MRFLTGLRAPKVQTLGVDFAGRIEAVGEDVTSFKVGDAVFGFNDLGASSHAEYLAFPANSAIRRVPEGLSFVDAAACLEGGWYAYSFIRRAGGVRLDQRVLINGADGAIGSALLQFCVHFGAAVTAVGNTKNLPLFRSLGASQVFDYTRVHFTTEARAADYDHVFDAVGKSSYGACEHLLKPHGKFSSSEVGRLGQNLFLAPITWAKRGKRVVFPLPVAKGAYLDFVGDLAARGEFHPVIERTYTLDQVREAYDYAASGQKTGNLVLVFE